MAYTTYTDVALMTNISTTDIANADITSIIAEATKELNRMINTLVVREPVSYIDELRDNVIDGTNTTFYVKNWFGRYIADRNDDGSVTTADIQVIIRSGDGTETEATVSSISASEGKFVLSSAPTADETMYVTYEWAYRNPATPDPLIKLACTLLSSAYCYAKINVGMSPVQSWGNVRLMRHMESFDHYYTRFLSVLALINQQMSMAKDRGDTL